MSATKSLRMRAEDTVDDIERKIFDEGGQVIGTITDIRRHLGINASNGVIREALGILCNAGRLSGAPLDSLSLSRGIPYKMYRYVSKLDPKQVLLERLKTQPINTSGTATKYLEALNLRGYVQPDEFDSIILGLKADQVIRAPIAYAARESQPFSQNAYLFLELA